MKGVRDKVSSALADERRVVHFYGEITEKEIYNIIQEELQDLDTFCDYIDEVLRDPKRFNLGIE